MAQEINPEQLRKVAQLERDRARAAWIEYEAVDLRFQKMATNLCVAWAAYVCAESRANEAEKSAGEAGAYPPTDWADVADGLPDVGGRYLVRVLVQKDQRGGDAEVIFETSATFSALTRTWFATTTSDGFPNKLGAHGGAVIAWRRTEVFP